MSNTDLLVLNFLGTDAGFAGHQVLHLRDWWCAAAEPGEALAAFLHRLDLISESSLQILRQIGEGQLTSDCGLALLDRSELDQVRRRLPEMAVLEGQGAIDATVTLLAADETAKDAVTLSLREQMPSVGSTLGRYLLTEWIGQGSTGSVFRALHPTLQIPVAIKVLHPISEGDGVGLQDRLKAEARLLALLNHPNIVRVYDFEAHSRQPFLVLEHVSGPSLAELIEQSGRVQPDRVVRIIRQLAEALAAAHQLGIVHRDVKPANVLLTRGGGVKLADLGLASVRSSFCLSENGLLPASARVGTARYLAPELIGTHGPADERSDMYSLGATFFHALTGRPPFEADEAWRVIELHAKAPAPCPRARVPDLPVELAELVTRMLAKSPADRPTSFAALLREPAVNPSYPLPPVVPVEEERPGAFWQRLLHRLRGREADRQRA